MQWDIDFSEFLILKIQGLRRPSIFSFCNLISNLFSKYRSALSSKGGKWTEKTLDKYLKSPADYAPGKLN